MYFLVVSIFIHLVLYLKLKLKIPKDEFELFNEEPRLQNSLRCLSTLLVTK